MQRIIALDVGRVRIGIAVSDLTNTIASPFLSYSRKNIKADLAFICKLAEEKEAQTIVIGLPLSMDGSENRQSESVRWFAEELKNTSTIPLVFADERFTTLTARQALISADVSREGRRQVVDKVAASIILQSYLDRQKNKN